MCFAAAGLAPLRGESQALARLETRRGLCACSVFVGVPMAIYHASMKIIGRQVTRGGKVVPGRHNSAVAAAAYQGGLKLRDERNEKTEDYSRKGGVAFTTVLTPEGAPEWMENPAKLWNAVEAREDESNRHERAQLARHLDFALPTELTDKQNQKLALAVGGEFLKRGMVAQVSIHEPEPKNGQRNPHSHILLTMREVTPDGFGKKNRDWNGGWMATGAPDGQTLKGWRKMIADHTNAALEEAGFDARVDERSYKDLGVNQVPTVHLGKEATAMQQRGEGTRQGKRQRVVTVLNTARRDGALEDESGGDGARVQREIHDKIFSASKKSKSPQVAVQKPDVSWQERERNKKQRDKSREPER